MLHIGAMARAILVRGLILLCLVTSNALGAAEPAARKSMADGVAAFERGAFVAAVGHWKKAEQLFHAEKNPRGQVEALVNLAAAYQSLGQHWLAVDACEQAVGVAEKTNERSSLLLGRSALGAALARTRRTERAERELQEALAMARADRDSRTAAAILNNLGGLLAEQGNSAAALEAFRECAALAQQVTNRLLAAQSLCNAAAAGARAGDKAEAVRLNGSAREHICALSASHDQALLWLRSGQTAARLDDRETAQQAYREALQVAQALGDLRAKSYALGYLGELLHGDEAMRCTREAAFAAQQIGAPEALYRWEWQTGRLLKAKGDTGGAIAAYHRALQTLRTIRHDLSISHGLSGASFREAVGPLFFEQADLLLQRAATVTDEREVEQMLIEARDTAEQLKSAELEDYFQDECVNILRAKSAPIERIEQQTAVVYIIPLADRTELLVGLPSGMKRFQAPIGAAQLTAKVRQFRLNLEKRTNEYREQGQQLYTWLIGPIKELLCAQKVNTLVFVPDGALRTIPMGALHDGKQFLIEQFAVAVAPGLTLIEPKSIRREKVRVLKGGLSEAVQGYAPLPNVPIELNCLRRLFTGPELLDRRFLLKALKQEFEQTDCVIVHLASHGQFDRDAAKTFILTYDEKLTLDQLEAMIRPSQFRDKSVELLTLSACQTAAGDDRAALGLAGVAVKAGARSALATLWFINDQSTATLICEFYQQLHDDEKVSKARALQNAQVNLLKDRRFEHPCYWAPYLIIGNWL